MSEYSVDQKSFDLAAHFLEDQPLYSDASIRHDATMALAREIQKAVEHWFEFDLPDYLPPLRFENCTFLGNVGGTGILAAPQRPRVRDRVTPPPPKGEQE